MTDFSFFGSTPPRTLPLIATALLFGVLVGCDSVEVRTTGTTTETTSDDPNEVEIRSDDFTRADIRFEPVSLASGKTFSIELTDQEIGRNVTRITHEGTTGRRHLLRAQFDPLQPASVSVQCRNEETGTEREVAHLEPGALESGSEGQMVGRTQEPTSYHYIQDGENTIVEVDYDDRTQSKSVTPSGTFHFPSVDQPLECTHVSFVMEDVSTSLTADGVRFSGGHQRPDFNRKLLR